MDTFFTSPQGGPAQDTAQQVPVPPGATFASSPIQELPQKKINIRKFFNISSWIILFALAPLTVLIFLSQDSIPGDLFYPVKRSLENAILAAASVNPATRAAFRTDLTEARFKEAQSLIVSKSNVGGLTTFIDEVQSAQLEAVSLSNNTQREKAEEKLINKLEEYQAGLSTLEAKTEQNIITYQFQQAPTLTPTSSNFPSTTPTIIPSPIPTKIPTVMPTSFPLPSSQPQFSPTSTPIPTIFPTTSIPTVVETAPTLPLQPENTQLTEQRKIVETIKDTKEKLDKIKKDLEENRNEEKEKREKRNEDDKSNKEEPDKKSGTSNRHK